MNKLKMWYCKRMIELCDFAIKYCGNDDVSEVVEVKHKYIKILKLLGE